MNMKRTLLILIVLIVGGGAGYFYLGMPLEGFDDLDMDEEIIVESIPAEIPAEFVQYAEKVEPLEAYEDEIYMDDSIDDEIETVEIETEVVAEPAPAPAPVPSPAPKVVKKQVEKPAKSGVVKPWAIGVSSFTTKKRAVALKKELIAGGYNTYMTEATVKDRLWYRVRVGFFETRAQAQAEMKHIDENFNNTSPWVVKPNSTERKKYSR